MGEMLFEQFFPFCHHQTQLEDIYDLGKSHISAIEYMCLFDEQQY